MKIAKRTINIVILLVALTASLASCGGKESPFVSPLVAKWQISTIDGNLVEDQKDKFAFEFEKNGNGIYWYAIPQNGTYVWGSDRFTWIEDLQESADYVSITYRGTTTKYKFVITFDEKGRWLTLTRVSGGEGPVVYIFKKA